MILLSNCQSSCQKKGEHASGAKDGVAATVNGVPIEAKEVDVLAGRAVEQYARAGRPSSPKLELDLRGSILRKMIDDELFKQQAKKENVEVDRVERVEALEKYKEKMGGAKNFERFLQQQNLTEDQVMQMVLADIQRDKIIQKMGEIPEPTEAEIKKHYEDNKNFYTVPEMVHAKHILLKVSENDPQEKVDLVLAKANKILKEAQGGAAFEALVQKYSEGPSSKQGGDLGFFGRGQMAKPFEDAAFNAPAKVAVGPVKTEFGYHIVYVEEKSPAKAAELDQVKGRVIEYIKRGKRSLASEDLLNKWRKSADITINDPSMTYEEYIKMIDREKDEKKQAKAGG